MSKKLHEMDMVPQRGTILLEVLVSVLILALGVLGIVGLQAAAIRSTTEAKLRADATFIANRTISDFWRNPDPASWTDLKGEADISDQDLPSARPARARAAA